MIAELSIVPIGGDESLSAYVAEAYRILAATGLPCERHAMGTNIEGNWDEVMAAINACRIRLVEVTGRVSISIRIDDRPGAGDRLRRKVPSAEGKMVG
jgi:uncharacterized protein (TIGR00106 family)